MLSRRTLVFAAFSAAFLVAMAAFSAYVRWDLAHRPKEYDGWQQIPWPFPHDNWNAGQAWRGHDLEVYVRPKLGFCSDGEIGAIGDSEFDRITDIGLVDPSFVPLETSHRIQVTDLVGRMRLYRLRVHGRAGLAEAIAVSYHCDLVVAIVLGNVADERLRKMAHRLLESDPVQDWINPQLGTR